MQFLEGRAKGSATVRGCADLAIVIMDSVAEIVEISGSSAALGVKAADERKKTCESGRVEVRWGREMIEIVMKARFEEYNDVLRDAKTQERSRRDGTKLRPYFIGLRSRCGG